ncbi:MAG: hypothetical protein HYT89_03675 [Candidatus Omnitrophica bacterium]|nr:hypothetical protein [Candidatus Omnitrophota bacterium]
MHFKIRAIAFFLVLTFLSEQLGFAAADFKPAKLDLFERPKVDLTIPESVAAIEDVFVGAGLMPARATARVAPTLYLLQDAHANASGQFNLAKTLDHLFRQRKGIRYVFIEAGAGDSSLSFLRAFGSREIRRRTAEPFVRNGLMHGEEYLDLTSDRSFVIWGVEDPGLYRKSLEDYRYVAKERERLERYLGKIRSTIATLKPRLYHPELLSFDRKVAQYKKGDLPLAEYARTLRLQAMLAGVDLGRFPQLKTLEELWRKEALVNFEAAGREQAAALGQLTPDDREDLLKLSETLDQSPFRLSSKDRREAMAFYTLLEEKAGDDFKKYPEFSRYLDYLKLAKKIDAGEVLEQVDLLEREIFGAMATTGDERTLARASTLVSLFEKLFKLTLTPREYGEYRDLSRDFGIARLAGFLNKKIMELEDFYESVAALEEGYDEAVRRAEDFYALTAARDLHFVDRAAEKMDKESQNEAVLITGGFHTAGLKALLKERGISYVSLTPQVLHETNLARYEKIILNQKNPLDRPVAPSAAAPGNLRSVTLLWDPVTLQPYLQALKGGLPDADKLRLERVLAETKADGRGRKAEKESLEKGLNAGTNREAEGLAKGHESSSQYLPGYKGVSTDRTVRPDLSNAPSRGVRPGEHSGRKGPIPQPGKGAVLLHGPRVSLRANDADPYSRESQISGRDPIQGIVSPVQRNNGYAQLLDSSNWLKPFRLQSSAFRLNSGSRAARQIKQGDVLLSASGTVRVVEGIVQNEATMRRYDRRTWEITVETIPLEVLNQNFSGASPTVTHIGPVVEGYVQSFQDGLFWNYPGTEQFKPSGRGGEEAEAVVAVEVDATGRITSTYSIRDSDQARLRVERLQNGTILVSHDQYTGLGNPIPLRIAADRANKILKEKPARRSFSDLGASSGMRRKKFLTYGIVAATVLIAGFSSLFWLPSRRAPEKTASLPPSLPQAENPSPPPQGSNLPDAVKTEPVILPDSIALLEKGVSKDGRRTMNIWDGRRDLSGLALTFTAKSSTHELDVRMIDSRGKVLNRKITWVSSKPQRFAIALSDFQDEARRIGFDWQNVARVEFKQGSATLAPLHAEFVDNKKIKDRGTALGIFGAGLNVHTGSDFEADGRIHGAYPYLDRRVRDARRKPVAVTSFENFSKTSTSDRKASMKKRWEALKANGQIPHVTLEFKFEEGSQDPRFTEKIAAHQGNSTVLQGVADGAYDALIEEWAETVAEHKSPVLFRLFHEFNGFWYPWKVETRQDADAFAKAWERAHRIFMEKGATNAVWVFSPYFWEGDKVQRLQGNVNYALAAQILNKIKDKVDLIGLDAYQKSPADPYLNESITGMLEAFRFGIFGKPFFLAEFGSSDETPARHQPTDTNKELYWRYGIDNFKNDVLFPEVIAVLPFSILKPEDGRDHDFRPPEATARELQTTDFFARDPLTTYVRRIVDQRQSGSRGAKEGVRDSSEPHHGYPRLSGKSRAPGPQTSSGSGNPPGLPRYPVSHGLSSYAGTDDRNSRITGGFVYPFSFGSNRGGLNNSLGNSRTRRPSLGLAQESDEVFGGPVAENFAGFPVSGRGSLKGLPPAGEKVELRGVRGGLGSEEKDIALHRMDAGRTQPLEGFEQISGNAGLHGQSITQPADLRPARESVGFSGSRRAETSSESVVRSSENLKRDGKKEPSGENAFSARPNTWPRLLPEQASDLQAPLSLLTPQSRMAMGISPADPVVRGENPYRNEKRNAQTGQHNRIHGLLTLLFGFGHNGDNKRGQEENNRRDPYFPRPLSKEIAHKTGAQDDLGKARAHRGNTGPLLGADNAFHNPSLVRPSPNVNNSKGSRRAGTSAEWGVGSSENSKTPASPNPELPTPNSIGARAARQDEGRSPAFGIRPGVWLVSIVAVLAPVILWLYSGSGRKKSADLPPGPRNEAVSPASGRWSSSAAWQTPTNQTDGSWPDAAGIRERYVESIRAWRKASAETGREIDRITEEISRLATGMDELKSQNPGASGDEVLGIAMQNSIKQFSKLGDLGKLVARQAYFLSPDAIKESSYSSHFNLVTIATESDQYHFIPIPDGSSGKLILVPISREEARRIQYEFYKRNGNLGLDTSPTSPNPELPTPNLNSTGGGRFAAPASPNLKGSRDAKTLQSRAEAGKKNGLSQLREYLQKVYRERRVEGIHSDSRVGIVVDAKDLLDLMESDDRGDLLSRALAECRTRLRLTRSDKPSRARVSPAVSSSEEIEAGVSILDSPFLSTWFLIRKSGRVGGYVEIQDGKNKTIEFLRSVVKGGGSLLMDAAIGHLRNKGETRTEWIALEGSEGFHRRYLKKRRMHHSERPGPVIKNRPSIIFTVSLENVSGTRRAGEGMGMPITELNEGEKVRERDWTSGFSWGDGLYRRLKTPLRRISGQKRSTPQSFASSSGWTTIEATIPITIMALKSHLSSWLKSLKNWIATATAKIALVKSAIVLANNSLRLGPISGSIPKYATSGKEAGSGSRRAGTRSEWGVGSSESSKTPASPNFELPTQSQFAAESKGAQGLKVGKPKGSLGHNQSGSRLALQKLGGLVYKIITRAVPSEVETRRGTALFQALGTGHFVVFDGELPDKGQNKIGFKRVGFVVKADYSGHYMMVIDFNLSPAMDLIFLTFNDLRELDRFGLIQSWHRIKNQKKTKEFLRLVVATIQGKAHQQERKKPDHDLAEPEPSEILDGLAFNIQYTRQGTEYLIRVNGKKYKVSETAAHFLAPAADGKETAAVVRDEDLAKALWMLPQVIGEDSAPFQVDLIYTEGWVYLRKNGKYAMRLSRSDARVAYLLPSNKKIPSEKDSPSLALGLSLFLVLNEKTRPFVQRVSNPGDLTGLYRRLPKEIGAERDKELLESEGKLGVDFFLKQLREKIGDQDAVIAVKLLIERFPEAVESDREGRAGDLFRRIASGEIETAGGERLDVRPYQTTANVRDADMKRAQKMLVAAEPVNIDFLDGLVSRLGVSEILEALFVLICYKEGISMEDRLVDPSDFKMELRNESDRNQLLDYLRENTGIRKAAAVSPSGARRADQSSESSAPSSPDDFYRERNRLANRAYEIEAGSKYFWKSFFKTGPLWFFHVAEAFIELRALSDKALDLTGEGSRNAATLQSRIGSVISQIQTGEVTENAKSQAELVRRLEKAVRHLDSRQYLKALRAMHRAISTFGGTNLLSRRSKEAFELLIEKSWTPAPFHKRFLKSNQAYRDLSNIAEQIHRIVKGVRHAAETNSENSKTPASPNSELQTPNSEGARKAVGIAEVMRSLDPAIWQDVTGLVQAGDPQTEAAKIRPWGQGSIEIRQWRSGWTIQYFAGRLRLEDLFQPRLADAYVTWSALDQRLLAFSRSPKMDSRTVSCAVIKEDPLRGVREPLGVFPIVLDQDSFRRMIKANGNTARFNEFLFLQDDTLRVPRSPAVAPSYLKSVFSETHEKGTYAAYEITGMPKEGSLNLRQVAENIRQAALTGDFPNPLVALSVMRDEGGAVRKTVYSWPNGASEPWLYFSKLQVGDVVVAVFEKWSDLDGALASTLAALNRLETGDETQTGPIAAKISRIDPIIIIQEPGPLSAAREAVEVAMSEVRQKIREQRQAPKAGPRWEVALSKLETLQAGLPAQNPAGGGMRSARSAHDALRNHMNRGGNKDVRTLHVWLFEATWKELKKAAPLLKELVSSQRTSPLLFNVALHILAENGLLDRTAADRLKNRRILSEKRRAGRLLSRFGFTDAETTGAFTSLKDIEAVRAEAIRLIEWRIAETGAMDLTRQKSDPQGDPLFKRTVNSLLARIGQSYLYELYLGIPDEQKAMEAARRHAGAILRNFGVTPDGELKENLERASKITKLVELVEQTLREHFFETGRVRYSPAVASRQRTHQRQTLIFSTGRRPVKAARKGVDRVLWVEEIAQAVGSAIARDYARTSPNGSRPAATTEAAFSMIRNSSDQPDVRIFIRKFYDPGDASLGPVIKAELVIEGTSARISLSPETQPLSLPANLTARQAADWARDFLSAYPFDWTDEKLPGKIQEMWIPRFQHALRWVGFLREHGLDFELKEGHLIVLKPSNNPGPDVATYLVRLGYVEGEGAWVNKSQRALFELMHEENRRRLGVEGLSIAGQGITHGQMTLVTSKDTDWLYTGLSAIQGNRHSLQSAAPTKVIWKVGVAKGFNREVHVTVSGEEGSGFSETFSSAWRIPLGETFTQDGWEAGLEREIRKSLEQFVSPGDLTPKDFNRLVGDALRRIPSGLTPAGKPQARSHNAAPFADIFKMRQGFRDRRPVAPSRITLSEGNSGGRSAALGVSPAEIVESSISGPGRFEGRGPSAGGLLASRTRGVVPPTDNRSLAFQFGQFLLLGVVPAEAAQPTPVNLPTKGNEGNPARDTTVLVAKQGPVLRFSEELGATPLGREKTFNEGPISQADLRKFVESRPREESAENPRLAVSHETESPARGEVRATKADILEVRKTYLSSELLSAPAPAQVWFDAGRHFKDVKDPENFKTQFDLMAFELAQLHYSSSRDMRIILTGLDALSPLYQAHVYGVLARFPVLADARTTPQDPSQLQFILGEENPTEGDGRVHFALKPATDQTRQDWAREYALLKLTAARLHDFKTRDGGVDFQDPAMLKGLDDPRYTMLFGSFGIVYSPGSFRDALKGNPSAFRYYMPIPRPFDIASAAVLARIQQIVEKAV